MDPGITVGIGVLSKIIGLGIKGWSALGERELGKDDLEALRGLLEVSASVASLRKDGAPTPGVLHLTLIAHSFGRAVARHQQFHGKLPLTGGWRRWMNHADREREDEIRKRVAFAALRVRELGNDPHGEAAYLAALTASPLSTPYYRALWCAFADPALTIAEAGEEPPLVMSHTARREFERYFLLAYLEGLATPGGAGIDEHIAGLKQYRAQLVRDLMISNLATWGQCHVFGNVPRSAWADAETVPFMPLDEVYIEPAGIVERDDKRDPAPPKQSLPALLERLTAIAARPTIVVVTADFGSGKSLTARALAHRWGERFLASSTATSLELALPIHVRCAEDFPSETVDLELTVRRAWKRQANGFGYSIADDDPAFAWPSSEQHAVVLLDGLDEVSLGEQHLKALFQRLAAKTTRHHRFVIFTRPGALLGRKDLGDHIMLVRVAPFDNEQIERWLSGWNALAAGRPAITLEALRGRGLADVAQTPILLFMVAFTWTNRAGSAEPRSLAEIYEQFFYQVAAGKADADREQHRPIGLASDELLAALKDASVLDEDAAPADAMLWMMGRIAWEAHMLEQRHPPQPLTRRHIDNLLHDGEVPVPPAAADLVRAGLVLALQADLHGANHTILFGHLSFREYLVARHWALQLRRLVRGSGRRDQLLGSLLGARLLTQEGKSFDFLVALINACAVSDADAAPRGRRASPLSWDDADRSRLVREMQEIFEDQRQEFGEPARVGAKADSTLRNDRRAELREAALAIGSTVAGSAGLRARDPLALRSMLAWFWLTSVSPVIKAPRAQLAKSDLHGTSLREATLNGANLDGSNLMKADLRGADLRGATLRNANLARASLLRADLRGAILTDAELGYAELVSANLCNVDLRRAKAGHANLLEAHLQAANLDESILDAAELGNADLRRARLTNASLMTARLRRADLRRADLERAQLVGADLRDAKLHGAQLRAVNLREADLRGADLREADLRSAELRGANLRGADLRDADLRGANVRGADLHVAALRGADLCRTDLHDVDLRGADLCGATLRKADLGGADLCGADLRDADLSGADLRGANLAKAELSGAILTHPERGHTLHDDETQWPAGYQIPEVGNADAPDGQTPEVQILIDAADLQSSVRTDADATTPICAAQPRSLAAPQDVVRSESSAGDDVLAKPEVAFVKPNARPDDATPSYVKLRSMVDPAVEMLAPSSGRTPRDRPRRR